MTMSTQPDTPLRTSGVTPKVEPQQLPTKDDDRELVEEEILVEDVSIDGMCGVY
jgi:mycofactocin precursor